MKKENVAVKWLLIIISVIFLVIMLGLPLVVVVVESLKKGVDAYFSAITNNYTIKALSLTLIATIVATVLNTIFILTFGRSSFLEPLLKLVNINVVFAVPGIVFATIFVTFPFITREIVPLMNSQGKDEEEAAAEEVAEEVAEEAAEETKEEK